MDEEDDDSGQHRVRPSAGEIYESVQTEAAEELKRRASSLAFSGLFAGATVGFSGLAAAAAASAVGSHGTATTLVAALFYPIGFVAVIIGRAQLFTENTLYPVTLVIADRSRLWPTARLWLIVLAANLAGTLAFAVLVVDTTAVPQGVRDELIRLGRGLADGGWGGWFWSAVLAGWLLALVAWLIEAGRAVVGQVMLIWSLTFVIGAAGLRHCVSTTAEVLSGVLGGKVGVGHFFSWLAAVVLGNIVGGVLIVTLLNSGQVQTEED